MPYSRIVGSGSYLPEKILSNQELEKTVNTSDRWIRERTGIEQRHIAAAGESACDLAKHAAEQALAMAQLDPAEIDLIVLATTTPDRVFPSTACLLQKRLGVRRGAAFDVQAVCTGFIYALAIADLFVRAGKAKNALVVGSEVLSRLIDWKDRDTCVLFGDGAGAVVLSAAAEPGIYSTHLHADGRHENLLYVKGDVYKKEAAYICMKGSEVFKMAVKTLGDIADETLAVEKMNCDDLDWLVPHQANHRIIAATAKKLKLDFKQVVVTVDRHGNTSAASIPLAFDQAVRDGRIQPGHCVLFEAFGGGFTWGSALLKF